MKRALIGVDLGSGGCKVLILDPEGKVHGQAFQEWPTQYPHAGWSEQNPLDWWEGLRKTLRKAASSYEEEFNRKVDRAVSVFEPAMIIIMSIIVCFIVLAVLLPIFQLNQLVK